MRSEEERKCDVTITFRSGTSTIHFGLPEPEALTLEQEFTRNPEILSVLIEYRD